MWPDSLQTAHALNQEVQTSLQVQSMYDSITYQKGALVVRMLMEWIGELTFFDGLQRYFREHHTGSGVATPADLYKAMAQARTEDKGYEENVRVDDLMNSWVKQPGFPVVEVSLLENKKNYQVVLMQKRFYSDP